MHRTIPRPSWTPPGTPNMRPKTSPALGESDQKNIHVKDMHLDIFKQFRRIPKAHGATGARKIEKSHEDKTSAQTSAQTILKWHIYIYRAQTLAQTKKDHAKKDEIIRTK